MKRFLLSLMMLTLGATMALAQAPNPDPGWAAFVIREASDGTTGAPAILDNDVYATDAVEFVIVAGGQKAGLGTDLINGATIDQIATLHIDRLDNVATSGSLYGPYFNIWVTDGAGHYAVLANEPSDAEWSGSPWDVADWAFLSTKRCKVYETPDVGASGHPGTSWVADYALLHGWDGVEDLRFEHVAGLVIEPPSAAYILDGNNNVGSGAPDELGTNLARGYNWIFGDTLANYVTGSDGFIVDNYSATADWPVENTTQGTGYSTIQAAINDADTGDTITIDAGTYLERPVVGISLTFIGEDEATTIVDAGAGAVGGSYGWTISGDNVSISDLTLVGDPGLSTPRYGFKPSNVASFSMTNVTAKEFYRTGVDLLGVTNGTLTNVSAIDNGGHGFSILDCNGVTVTDATATGNGWQGVSVATWGRYSALGTSGIVFTGTTSISDPFQLEMGDYNNPGTAPTGDAIITYSTDIADGADLTVQAADYTMAVHGTQDDSPDQIRIWLAPDLATAALLPAIGGPVGHFTGEDMFIESLVDDVVYVTPGCDLAAAVAGATAGETIDIQVADLDITSQVVIDKDLTLSGAGAGSTTLHAGYNTTTGYVTTSGMIYVDYGVTATIADLAIDGVGYTVNHAIQSRGADLAVRDCAITNIMSSTYDGRGVVFHTGTGTVESCVMSGIQRIGVHIRGGIDSMTSPVVAVDGLTYTGKGDGDWLDYGVEFGGGGQGSVANSTMTACTGEAYDGSTSSGILATDYYGTGTIADISGTTLTGNTSGVMVGYNETDISQVTIHGCEIYDNTSYGVSTTGVEVDATGNWWGTATGPYNLALNPAGTGNQVSDNVLFDPWIGMAGGAVVPAATGPLNCSETATVTVQFTADEYTPELFLYNAVVSATTGLDFGTIQDSLPFTGTNETFLTYQSGTNEWTITGSTVGNPTFPVSGPGIFDLFTIDFTATASVAGTVTLESLTLRDPDNLTIPVALSNAAIEYDCDAPATVTGITATPGHNKIDVSWTHDGTDVDHYEVFSGLWHDGTPESSAYPEYDDYAGDVIPTPPADYAAALAADPIWLPLTAVATTNQTQSWSDAGDRGVYYYTVFAVDAAGNASAAPAAVDRATNYWLGDVVGDFGTTEPNGLVNTSDMERLGINFGISITTDAPEADLDVGPTDDWSRLGVPTTDSFINFEDLMVFAMNFGVVSDAKDKAPTGSSVDLAWVAYDDGTMALRLLDGANLKGLRVTADTPIHGVTEGALLDEQSELTFLKNVGEKLDASVAVMGTNNAFGGTGDLLVVSAASAIAVDDLVITARGSDNRELEIRLSETSDTPLPRVFALQENYPNPFNPQTKIAFSLPESQHVRLTIYGVDGRVIRTLVDETRGAGLHEIVWQGRDGGGRSVASGTYFYRIEAGPYSDVKKMTLMK